MHPLQKHILHELMFNSSLAFSKIKPDNIESNLFMYHLKLLIRDGLVEKGGDGKYQLTLPGKQYADKLSLKAFKPRIQPNISTLVICQNDQGQYLLYKKRRQPFINLIGFPYGKIHLGEKIKDAAQREFEEKTNLTSTDLTHLGDMYTTVYQGKNLFTHTFFHIFEAQNFQGSLKQDSDIGLCFWSKIEDINPKELIPVVTELYNLIRSVKPSQLFFEEFVYQL